MSVYLDASVIVPLFVQEKTSEAVLAWMASVDRAIAEVSSAMSHHVRRRSLDPDERNLAETKFNIWLDRAAAVREVEPEDVTACRFLLHRHPRLRTPDALHLAIVQRLECDLATYDHDLADAARRDGVKVIAP
ncbi:hypothetical protein ER13_18150 [Brevundimonas sp. EAKA]|uniref:Ribonuclease VapC n=1 Tax=Brevundimonas mediterranea TaxID=74329 RepID=A0A7Z8Y632_9CAUL|nr:MULTISPECIES: type II toxin-antitoxin system VapC family toxin [Brevundimonas]KDP93532.1 hypothetical protein ER13_18150 [Brevundimonas sp. EAKA]VDC51564.1 Ribonuclease VapC46 [Brevundimonas mediterranea]